MQEKLVGNNENENEQFNSINAMAEGNANDTTNVALQVGILLCNRKLLQRIENSIKIICVNLIVFNKK